MAHLSIIIPTYNGADTLAEQLDALASQRRAEPFEVILSDNGSTDNSRAIAREYASKLPGLRIIDASQRRGRSYARNAGAAAAMGEALAFCDQDDVVGEGWVGALSRALDEHDFVTGSIECERLNPPWRTRHFTFPRDGLMVHHVAPRLAHAPGCNLGIRRSLHLAIGGFDESMMLAWEDTDYAFRLQLAGHAPYFVKDAVVHYRLRHNLPSIYRQAKSYGEGNVDFYKKYASMAPLRESWRRRIRSWTSLARPRVVLGLRDKARLALWLWQLGWRVGHLRGCVKQRILAPAAWV